MLEPKKIMATKKYESKRRTRERIWQRYCRLGGVGGTRPAKQKGSNAAKENQKVQGRPERPVVLGAEEVFHKYNL